MATTPATQHHTPLEQPMLPNTKPMTNPMTNLCLYCSPCMLQGHANREGGRNTARLEGGLSPSPRNTKGI